MSISSALLAGVSGLVANSSALAAISENIANANTVGYKTLDTAFSDIVSDSGVTGDYDAGGVQATTQQAVTQQGQPQATSSSTDLSIVGQGFFVVTSTANPTVSDPRDFTRAGSFTVDSNGDLENASGQFLQGWPVNSDGQIVPPPSPSDINALQTINVSNVGGAVAPTTQVSIGANLNSQQPANAGAATYDPTNSADNMASGAVTPDLQIQIPVSDTQGSSHNLELDLMKDPNNPNTWDAELVASPASDIQEGTGLVNGQIATGTLSFNSDGSINMANSTLFGGSTTPSITIGASSTTPGAGQVSWAANLGVGAQTIGLNLSGITQDASTSQTTSVVPNGTQFGNLTGVTISASGLVTASFDNGTTRDIAQVALATFPNPDGLTSVSGNAYQVSPASGTFNLKTPGDAGAGTLDPSTLEASTVDLSQQFAGLITTQEAYSASAKILTTADQMIQTLINVKQ